jgi:hypothetical protein
MRNVSNRSCRKKQNTPFPVNFVFENRAAYEIKWKKYCRAGEATDENKAHARFTLGTYGYEHTFLE